MLSAGTLVYLLATGSLVALACVALDAGCRALRLATRWVWALGLASLLGLVARAVMGSGTIAIAAPVRWPVAAGAATSARVADPLAQLHGIGALVGGSLQFLLATLAHALPADTARLAALGWLIASALALLVITGVHLRVAALRRRWPSTVLHGHPVRVAADVGPAVLGLARPIIVVPRWLLARPEQEQRLVLAHEREHVRAGDHLVLALACLAAALVPWQPGVWLIWRRLRLAIELDCDARVLRAGVRPGVYGSLLIDLAGQGAGFPVGAPALADEASHLERRLLAMTPTAARPSRLRLGTLAVAGALLLLAACEAKVPTAAEIQAMDVAGAERSAARVQMVDAESPNTTYYVDGVRSDAATAHAIPADRIGTMDVRKTNDASEIRITTLASPLPAGAERHTSVVRVESRGPGDSTVTGGLAASGRPRVDLGNFPGVVFVDGVRVSDGRALGALRPGDITSIEIFKGPKARELSSDPAAVNGIIRVTTKAGAAAAARP